MDGTEKRTAVCNFNVEPSVKETFYAGCQKRGLSATFLFRRLMVNKVTEFKMEDAEKDEGRAAV